MEPSHSIMLTMASSSVVEVPPPERPGVGGYSDGDLLQRFLADREEAAFAQLVHRFGPLVMNTALRAVHDRQTAEDVFQATFLMLVKDAQRIRRPESVGAWLHGVARRLSHRAAKRRPASASWDQTEPQVAVDPIDELIHRQQQELLDEELQRLPQSYREVLVLHFLEGLSCEQTAASLAISVGAARGRLQRGKHELRLRLLKRGVELTAVLAAISNWKVHEAIACESTLKAATVQSGVAFIQGTAFVPGSSSEAIYLINQGTTMWTLGKSTVVALVLFAVAGLGWSAHRAFGELPQNSPWMIPDTTLVETGPSATALGEIEIPHTWEWERRLTFYDDPAPTGKAPQLSLKYDDGKPDGKRSIAGTGQMIRFTLPDKRQKLRNLRIHSGRYGQVQPPDEDVEVTIVSDDGTEILHTEFVPYATFKRGESRWTTIRFEEPVTVPENFWVIFQFNAESTKGVYVSFDTSTAGKYSKVGLPGADSSPVNFEGDWMIQAILTSPEPAASNL